MNLILTDPCIVFTCWQLLQFSMLIRGKCVKRNCVHGPCERLHLCLLSDIPKLVKQACVGAFVLLMRASNSEGLWFLFARVACLQWTEAGSVYTKRVYIFHTCSCATVMMEVVALHIPLNQSLALCALGHPCSCFFFFFFVFLRCLCKLKTYFGSCTYCIFWMA